MISTRLLAALAGCAFAACTFAQERYPARPITLIIPLSSGTTADIVARLYADRLAQRLGQPVVVQNRPGAGGTIGTEQAARAAPDGYTIVSVNSQHSINPFVIGKLAYDTQRDFAGIAMIAEAPALVAVHPSLGVKTLAEFIALARQKPGTINYGSAGIGSATHLAGAAFAARAGVNLVHIPYKTGNELMADLVGGRVEATFSPVAFLAPNVKAGKLVALGITSSEAVRDPVEAPPVADAGNMPGFEYSTWYGFVAPAKVPRPILERIAVEMKAISSERDVRERFAAQGILPRAVLLGDFDAYIRTDMERIEPIIRASGAKSN